MPEPLILILDSAEVAEEYRRRRAVGERVLLARSRDELELHLSAAKPVRRVWIGEGTNTWKSDLDLGIEYVRTNGPAGRPGATLGVPWMAGIPGTIGGWVKMNAGAFGHSISELVEAVEVDGIWRPRSACGFGYRHSDLDGEIGDVRFVPFPAWTETAADYLSRRKRYPAGTYGSFFKNPEGDFAGRLLEAVGCKELSVGGAVVWGEHANVIVRRAGWTGSDVLALAYLMRERVRDRFGIALEPEVRGISFGEIANG